MWKIKCSSVRERVWWWIWNTQITDSIYLFVSKHFQTTKKHKSIGLMVPNIKCHTLVLKIDSFVQRCVHSFFGTTAKSLCKTLTHFQDLVWLLYLLNSSKNERKKKIKICRGEMMKINFSHTTARIEIQMFFLIEIKIYRFQFMLAHQTKKIFVNKNN